MFCLLITDTLQELMFVCPYFRFLSFAFMDVVVLVLLQSTRSKDANILMIINQSHQRNHRINLISVLQITDEQTYRLLIFE